MPVKKTKSFVCLTKKTKRMLLTDHQSNTIQLLKNKKKKKKKNETVPALNEI